MNKSLSQFKEPSDLKKRKQRQEQLNKIIEPLIADRINLLISFAENKKVLDIGCVQNNERSFKNKKWLHGILRGKAKKILGIDILYSEIKVLRSQGYNVVCHDITTGPLPGKFEVIIAGEVIEHVENLGKFLSNVKKNLSKNGMIILTTPYPWFFGVCLRNIFAGIQLGGSLAHTAWHEPFTLCEMARRKGLRISRIYGLKTEVHGKNLQAKLVALLCKVVSETNILPFNKLIGCRSILYCLKKYEA